MNYDKKDYYWWKAEKNQAHTKVFPYIAYLKQEQQHKQLSNMKHMRLYGSIESFGSRFYDQNMFMTSGSIENRITMNIVQSMVDTVVSKITKNKPKPIFLTDGGDFSLQRRAKKLTQFTQGQFYATNYYTEKAKAFKDACIFGTGAVKIFKTKSGIKAERTFIDEIIVDDNETLYGEPRQMHQVKLIHKDVLAEAFPDSKAMIEQCYTVDNPTQHIFTPSSYKQSDMVVVIESWHLKSGPDATDGKHTISIFNDTLFEEEYKSEKFPFVFYRWNERPVGFFGQGLAEQLAGIQLEINKILRTIQVSMHLVSIPKIFLEAGSKVVHSHLDNKIGGIITYTGTPPQPGQLGQIPPDLFNHLDRLYTRAFEIAGVSQLSAQSTKPSGLDSGKALREFNDIESERFMDVGVRYEKGSEDAAALMIGLCRELYEQEGDFDVKVAGRDFLKTIKWSEVNLDDSKYIMQSFPTSHLSSTPSGKLQDVQELLTAGFISKEEGLQLLDFPDLANFNSYQNAALKDIDHMIEKIVDKKEYNSPEPYQNLQAGVVRMQQAYLKYKSEGAPDDVLELFRRWIDDAETLMQKAAEPAQDPMLQDPMLGGAQDPMLQDPSLMGALPQMPSPGNVVVPPTGDIPIMPEAPPILG